MEIEKFLDLARQYCATIQEATSCRPYALLERCAVLLPQLYAAAMVVREVQPGEEDLPDPDVASPMGVLLKRLGSFDLYMEVFDPVYDKEATPASLSGDLAEIYLDLAKSIRWYDDGHMNEAVWELRFGLSNHWGNHLVDAMRAIHRLVHDHMSPDYEPEGA